MLFMTHYALGGALCSSWRVMRLVAHYPLYSATLFMAHYALDGALCASSSFIDYEAIGEGLIDVYLILLTNAIIL